MDNEPPACIVIKNFSDLKHKINNTRTGTLDKFELHIRGYPLNVALGRILGGLIRFKAH